MLGGQVLVRLFGLPALVDTGLEGHVITAVETRGKHLLVRFDDGRVLHTHMKMAGAWIVGAAGAPVRAPVAALETRTHLAALVTRARGAQPFARLLSADAMRREPRLRALGPDLLDPAFDLEEAVVRLRAATHPTLAEALLDQRVVAGIGNEYKSEVCFLCAVHPATSPSALTDATARALLGKARELMAFNVRSPSARRITRFASGSSRWVYGRAGEPGLRCGARVERVPSPGARSTYACPRCQR